LAHVDITVFEIFSFRASYETKEDLRAQISSLLTEKIVFVPSNAPLTKLDVDVVRPGRFRAASEHIFWHDPTGIFDKYRHTFTITTPPVFLEPLYADQKGDNKLRELFTEHLRIQATPDLSDYVHLLEHVALLASTNKAGFSGEEVLDQVYTLYEMVVDKCVEMTKVGEPVIEEYEPRILNRDMTGLVVGCRVKNLLVELIKFKWIIPCFRDKWTSMVEQTGDKSTKILPY